MRTFAKITLLPTKNIKETKHLSSLGPEILDASFTKKIFTEALQKKPTLPIKTALMEQDLFVGVGNIYSDEILWLAGVKPDRTVKSLDPKELSFIFKYLKPVLQKGIDFKGDSTSDYRTIDGTPGEFHLNRNAYRKTGESCNKRGCPGAILRKVIRGRSAHYCSDHQK
jgi:formamidopyrimidine-DNA glycosylase